MNYESLNENVLLIELTQTEMKQFDITYDSLSNNAKTTAAVKKILRTINPNRNNTNQKIVVEALPTQSGGCFFIFTFKYPKKYKYRVKKPNSLILKTRNIDDLLDFISASKKQERKKIICSLYKMNDRYFVILPKISTDISPTMTEFGEISDNCSAYTVAEHGSFIGKITI